MKKLFFLTILFFFFKLSYGQNWSQLQKIVASDRDTNNVFGWSVSISDNYAIVGAPHQSEDVNGGNYILAAGATYIFEKDSSGNWLQVQKIVASDRDTGDWFGSSVSISGNNAIISASHDAEDANGGNSMYNAGSAYIFERDVNGNWSQAQKIVASDRDISDYLGHSVSISGNYAIVGAHHEDENVTGGNTMISAGSAYIFERDTNGNWDQVQKIVASDRSSDDLFGFKVSINGNYALVGAFYEDEDASGVNTMSRAGSAYIFERDISGNWNQVQKIVASDRAAFDYFGYSVSINGNYAMVGATWESEDLLGGNTLLYSGSAYIFERDTVGIWSQVQKIIASDRDTMDQFGISVSINSNYAIVGAWRDNEDATGGNFYDNAGSAYVFAQDGNGNWNQVEKIVASDRADNETFGMSVSISGDNSIVGACQDNDNATGGNPYDDAGSAFIFKNCMTKSNISHVCCFSYTSPSGNYIWTSSGSYMDTIPNAADCDSIISVNLTINLVDTSVNKSSITLTANATGATFQWLDCNNGYAVIAGATSQTYTPTSNGSYAVEIKQNGCIDTSACYSITNIGVIENDFGPFLNIYPNPTSGEITIELGGIYIEVDIIVRNLIGQVILTRNFGTTNLVSFDIRGTKGFYFVELHTAEGKSAILRVFKE